MLVERFALHMLPTILLMLTSAIVWSQDYPNKPIRIVTATAGGGSDFSGRIIATGISPVLGQPVIVDNRATNIAPEVVAHAPPDGYTLLINGSSFWNNPFLEPTPYDPVKDLAPLMITDVSYQVLVAHPSMPGTVKEVIALAKAKPGQINIGTGQSATSGHLAMEQFKAQAGIDIVRVPYKGGSAALLGLMGNEVQLLFTNDTSILTQAKAGKLKVLGVASLAPTPLAPGIPTLASSGLPGFRAQTNTVMFAPAKTATPIITKLNQEIARVLNRPETKEKFLAASIEVVASSPSELAELMKSDMAVVGKLIQDAHIKAN